MRRRRPCCSTCSATARRPAFSGRWRPPRTASASADTREITSTSCGPCRASRAAARWPPARIGASSRGITTSPARGTRAGVIRVRRWARRNTKSTPAGIAPASHLLDLALPLKTLRLTGGSHSARHPLDAAQTAEVIAAGRDFAYRGDEDRYEKRTTEQLLAGLSSWSPFVRKRSAAALGKREGDHLPALLELLAGQHRDARYGAIEALGALGPRADAAATANPCRAPRLRPVGSSARRRSHSRAQPRSAHSQRERTCWRSPSAPIPPTRAASPRVLPASHFSPTTPASAAPAASSPIPSTAWTARSSTRHPRAAATRRQASHAPP